MQKQQKRRKKEKKKEREREREKKKKKKKKKWRCKLKIWSHPPELKPPTPTWNPPTHGPTPIWSHPLRSLISSLSFSLTASTTPISKSPMPPLQHLAFASESNFALNSLLWIFLNFWRFFSMLGFGLRALSPWILFVSNLMHSFSL